MEDSEDLHVCLKCHDQIFGLDNYIEHRRSNCKTSGNENEVQSPPKNEDTHVETSRSDAHDVPEDPVVQQGDDEDGVTHTEKPRQKRKTAHPRRIEKGVVVMGKSKDSIQLSVSPRVVLHRLSSELSISPDRNKTEAKETSEVSVTRTRRSLKPRRFYEDCGSDYDDKPPTKITEVIEESVTIKQKKPNKKKGGRAKKILSAEEEDALEKSKVEDRFICAPCNFSSLSSTSFLKHLKTTKHIEHMANSQGDTVAQFQCEKCPTSFFTENGLANHILRHEQQSKCAECGSTFETRTALRRHHKTEHLKEHRTSNLDPCEICGKKFSKGYMKIHLRIHSGERPYACDICPFKSNQKGDLLMHKKRHYGIKDHKCPDCDFVTVRSSILKNHMLIHTKRERTEECHICLLKFYNKNLLRSHIYMKHVLARVHPCTFSGCTYKFKYHIELVAHTRTHTNEKPFLCSVCGYSGTTKQALTRHFRKHTGDKPFKCEFPGCSYMGRVSTHLTRHKRLHTGEKPYKCPYCNYRANTHENVRKHIRCTKKHAGLSVYTCKFCNAMQTDRYQDLVDHMRQAHAEHYLTFDKVSHQSGLLADKEELPHAVDIDEETSVPTDDANPVMLLPNSNIDINSDLQIDISTSDVNPDPQLALPTSADNPNLQIAVPSSEVNHNQQIHVPEDVPTAEVNPDLEIAVPTSDVNHDLQIAVATSESNQEFILCQVVQEGSEQHHQGEEVGSKDAEDSGRGREEMQEIQMVTVEEGEASQAIQMLLQRANGEHASQDFIII